MKNGSVAIGVIGAGIMGERLLNAIRAQDRGLLHACGIWDPAPAAMQRMERTFPDLPRLADAASVIAASDCVYIASPPASHLTHARAALQAGKSVFCEKPLAVDVADARAFVAQAGDRGAVNFPFASSPAVATLRSWVETGAIGTPKHITIEVGFARWPRPWQVDAAGWPAHFFEVELRGIVRHRNDQLLNPAAIEEYLSQVAPVPFSPAFTYGEEIGAFLGKHVAPGDIDIHASNTADAIFRPHRDRFQISEGIEDQFREIELLEIPSIDGSRAAVGWVLHHGYKGAIPPRAMMRGLRVRSGNIQIGGHDLFQELFPEPRFNSWSVGEIHILDPRIVPNGRRDHFEQNVHFDNLLSHLSPVTRNIAHRCRTNSLVRNWIREFDRSEQAAKQKLAIIKQGSIGIGRQSEAAQDADRILVKMERIAGREAIAPEIRKKQRTVISQIRKRLERLRQNLPRARVLSKMSTKERRLIERVFGLVYECSSNHAVAKMLVDRILKQIS